MSLYQAQVLNTIGIILEIIGIIITFWKAPVLLDGSFMKESNYDSIDANNDAKKKWVALAGALIIIGACCQLFQSIKSLEQYKAASEPTYKCHKH